LAEDLTMQQTSCVPKGVLHAKLLTAWQSTLHVLAKSALGYPLTCLVVTD
jgi:hypothetical protein